MDFHDHDMPLVMAFDDDVAPARAYAMNAERLHASFGCLQAVIELYDRAIQLDPQAEYFLGRAYINMYARKDIAALEDSSRALALNPALILALYIRATVHFDMTRRTTTASGRSYHNARDTEMRSQARQAFISAERGYRLSCAGDGFDRIDPRILLGRLYSLRRLATRAEALTYLESLLTSWPAASMRVWIDVAAINTYQELNMADEASRMLLGSQGRVARLPLARSWILYNQALRLEPKRSLPLFQQSLRLFFGVEHAPTCRHAVDYLNRISSCHEGLGDVASALEILTQGLARYPESASLLHARGLLYSDNGQTANALDDMYRARDLEPNSITRYNAIMAVLGDARRFSEMWEVGRNTIPMHFGIEACVDVCFLSMIVISATFQEQFIEARRASDRMLDIQGFLAHGDLEFVGHHRTRLFSSMWATMQKSEEVRVWLITIEGHMRHKRILGLHRHLCDSVALLGRESIDWLVSSDGCTALFWAASECTDRPELVKALVLGARADVAFRNTVGRSALSFAVQNNHPRIARALVAFGADPTRRDCLQYSPIDYLQDKRAKEAMTRAFAEGAQQYGAHKQGLIDYAFAVLSSARRSFDRNSFSLVVHYWAPTADDVVEYVRHQHARGASIVA